MMILIFGLKNVGSLLRRKKRKLIEIEVVPVRSVTKDPYFLILFREGNGAAVIHEKRPATESKDSKDARITSLEQKLQEAKEYMKIMSEEFEATREELQSANEEVFSSNEELQSINEELETSKEELQSTNEELTTVNEELQQRSFDLKEVSDLSKAIIETIKVPLLVLTTDMRIQTANKAFFSLFKTNIDRTEGHYFFEMEGGHWNIPGLKRKLIEIVDKNKSFESFQISNVFTSVGQKNLLFNAKRLDQIENKKMKLLIVIEDVTPTGGVAPKKKPKPERKGD